MNQTIGTGNTEACPNPGSFMVVAARAKSGARVSDKDETMIGSSDVTLGSTKRKKLRCVECGTKFRPSSVKVHSWKTPIGVFLIILLVGLSVRAFYQFSAMQDGIDSEPDTQSASSSSDKPVVEPCLGAVQNTPYADDQSATQELEDVLEQAPSDVEAGISETNNSNTSDSSPRATGLYDQKQEIVEPSQAELERLDLELAERTASSQEQVQRVEQSLSNADQEERIALLRVTVAQSLETWRAAWESGDLETYLNSYAQGYTPSSDISNATWRSQRKYRLAHSLPRQITLSNFDTQCDLDGAKCVVEFDQLFEAPLFTETSRKRLEFAAVSADDFKLIAETSLD